MNADLIQEKTAVEGKGRPVESNREALFERVLTEYSQALARLASGYESVAHRRQDLLQDIHLKLWQSLASFDGRCSLRTWVYRIAHNTAVTYVTKETRLSRRSLVGLEELDSMPAVADDERNADAQRVMERLGVLVRTLKPIDRQVVLLQLEGLQPADIATIVGISPGNVSIKLHRFNDLLKKHFTIEKQP